MKKRHEPVFNLSHYLLGVRFDNWLRLLCRAGFRIDRKKIPQTVLITLLSLVLMPFVLVEALVCAIPIACTKPKKDPVFILGHWRSGTTYLQDIMSQDPQFGWPSPLHAAMFSNCVLLGWLLKGGVQEGIKGARPMDNVQYKMSLPMEEVFCMGNFTPYMLSHLVAFPIVWDKYIPAAYVDQLPTRQRNSYKRDYTYAMKKLTMLCGGRQLLLKSPDNTAHLGALLEMYPDAKFINIYRDPYDAVNSTVNMFKKQLALLRLSKMPEIDFENFIEDIIVERLFAPMYRDLIARENSFRPSQFIQIRYEDFVTEPTRYLRKIYDALGLEGFDKALSRFEAYAAAQKDYRKNRHDMSPALREKINRHLGFYFEHYGYAMQTEAVMEG